jgi:hypothetical protein
MQITPKTVSVVSPEDGRLTPETSRGLRHNKVFVKGRVKVYYVGYVIVTITPSLETNKLFCSILRC